MGITNYSAAKIHRISSMLKWWRRYNLLLVTLVLLSLVRLSDAEGWLAAYFEQLEYVDAKPSPVRLPKMVMVSVEQPRGIIEAVTRIFQTEQVNVDAMSATSCDQLASFASMTEALFVVGSTWYTCQSLPDNVLFESSFEQDLKSVHDKLTTLQKRKQHRDIALTIHLDTDSSHAQNSKELWSVWVSPLLDQFKPFVNFEIESVSKYHSLDFSEIPGHEISPTVHLPHLLRLIATTKNRALPGWGCAAAGDAATVASVWINFLRREIFGFAPSDVPLTPLEKVLVALKIEPAAFPRHWRSRMTFEATLVVFLPLLFPPLIGFIRSR